MNETFSESGVTLKFGTVSASRPGFARVRLPDTDNMRTMWLPIAYPKTQDDECYWTYDIGEQVAVLLDALGEDGVILGAIYSDVDVPPITDPNKFGIRFKDGAELEYDRGTHTLTVRGGVQKVIVEAGEAILLKAGTKVTVDTPDTEFTGNVTVLKKLTYIGGMDGAGGNGGPSAVFDGGVQIRGGDLDVDGIKFRPHTHPNPEGGSTGVAQ